MKNLRLFFISGLILLFILVNSVCVFASNNAQNITVFDNADLLTPEEETKLIEKAKQYSNLPIDIVFLTYANNNGLDTLTYTDIFYDKLVRELNYDIDGIMFAIDMQGREVYISTSEMVVDLINDAELDRAIDKGYSSLRDGDYYKALEKISKSALSTVEHWYLSGTENIGYIVKETIINSLWFSPILILVFISRRKKLLKKHNEVNNFVSAEANIPGKNMPGILVSCLYTLINLFKCSI